MEQPYVMSQCCVVTGQFKCVDFSMNRQKMEWKEMFHLKFPKFRGYYTWEELGYVFFSNIYTYCIFFWLISIRVNKINFNTINDYVLLSAKLLQDFISFRYSYQMGLYFLTNGFHACIFTSWLNYLIEFGSLSWRQI